MKSATGMNRYIRLPAIDFMRVIVGPSSSHTAGAHEIGLRMNEIIRNYPEKLSHVSVGLYNSLSFTGKGHMTDVAICAGLAGVPIGGVKDFSATFRSRKALTIRAGGQRLTFNLSRHLVFEKRRHPMSGNIAVLRLYASGKKVGEHVFESIGGGRIKPQPQRDVQGSLPLRFRYGNWATFSRRAMDWPGKLIDFVVRRDGALTAESNTGIRHKMLERYLIMMEAVELGKALRGFLPGRLTRYRSWALFKSLEEDSINYSGYAPAAAAAVSEHNASMGMMVAAPTAGGGGVLPGVLYDLRRKGIPLLKLVDSLFIASVIGQIIEHNACISGAKAGCTFEVGAAESMAAAAGIYALMEDRPGGKRNLLDLIEQGAEMALEHSSGMPCDPVGGLVQIPCIERNIVKAGEAMTIIGIVLSPNPYFRPRVGLDTMIALAYEIGRRLPESHRETSMGGLAAAKLKPTQS